MMKKQIAIGGIMGMLGIAALGQTQPAMPGFEADYLKVMHVMKAPSATGVLVADVARDGPGDKGGLGAGDIITSYGGTVIETIAGLKQAMAEALAAQMDDGKGGSKIEMKVERGGKALVLIVERGGLEVTPVAVRAGVACPLNPPPTAKGALHLAWDALLPPVNGATGDAAVQAARREYLVLRTGDGTATSYMQWTLGRDGAEVESEMKVFLRDDPEEAALHITTRFAASDGVDVPAFLLDTMGYDNPLAHLKVQREGARLVERGRGEDGPPEVTQTALGAIPLECGIEAVAAAMPQEAGKVLGFTGVDSYALQTRPGYVLVTLGKRKVTIDKQEEQLWGVEEMRFGQVEMTWWFDDQRRLMVMEAADLRGERVATEDLAKAMVMPAKAK